MASRQIEALKAQLEVIWKTDEVDYQALERLGFQAEGNGAAPGTLADAASAASAAAKGGASPPRGPAEAPPA